MKVQFGRTFQTIGFSPLQLVSSQTGGKALGLSRAPDYVSFNLNIAIANSVTGTWVGWSGTVSVDRYGDVFYSPFGVEVGKSRFAASYSLTGNWLNQSAMPSRAQLSNFLSTSGYNVTGGYGGGGISESYTPGSGWATGSGIMMPQAGGSYNYSFYGGNLGFSW